MQTKKLLNLSALTIILFSAAAIRFWGIDFGLPFLYNTDEPNFVMRAFRILGTGDLNPHWFGHPGSFTIYSLALIMGIYAFIGLALGHFTDLASIELITRTDPSEFYLVGRLLIFTFGIAVVYLTYCLGKAFRDRLTGLFSALIVGASPLAIELSRLIRTDMQMVAFVLITLFFCMKISEDSRLKYYILSGLFLGLAISTKYPAVIACLSIVTAHILFNRRKSNPILFNFRLVVISAISSIIGAFLAAPFLFLDFGTALQDVSGEARDYHLSSNSYGLFDSVWRYITDVVQVNISLGGLTLAAVSIITVISSPLVNYKGVVLLSFLAPFIFFISSLNLWWERWGLPLIPVFSIFAAHGLLVIVNNFNSVRYKSITISLFFLTMLLPINKSFLETKELATSDTRTVAFNWIEDNVPKGSLILIESYTPQLIRENYRIIQPGFMTLENQPAPTKYYRALGVIGELESAEAIKQASPDYIIIGNQYERRKKGGPRLSYSIPIYNYIFEHYEQVFQIDPKEGVRSGNRVRIFSKPNVKNGND
tara:strand:- start:33645 stop:35258 length:1614 start_codon:yes stop_codon:yes gene_type:complete